MPGVTPRSPRRPLAELDQSQLDQRLLHSPSLTSQSSLSPSLLLTSQLPPSMERLHRHTERQLTELHFSQQKRMVLEQERDQLEALLEEKEHQMEALNAEYSADLNCAQQVRYLVVQHYYIV